MTRALDGYIASLYSAYIRAAGQHREALGKALDLALEVRRNAAHEPSKTDDVTTKGAVHVSDGDEEEGEVEVGAGGCDGEREDVLIPVAGTEAG